MKKLLALGVLTSLLLGCSPDERAGVGTRCDPGFQRCGSACIPVLADDANCGGCGIQCDDGESCAAGACSPDDCSDADCGEGQVCPEGACRERLCVGVTCPAGRTCHGGACVAEACADKPCPRGHACVDGECTDVICVRVTCPTGSQCRLGRCVFGTCADDERNFAESDVDCGGGTCPKCGEGRRCVRDPDCEEGLSCAEGTCSDVDECAIDNGGCSVRAECTNTVGGFTCACRTGFSGDGVTCDDVDECETDNGGCDPLASCTNTEGGHTCGSCPDGYTGSGESGCTDEDECTAGTHDCSENATCANTTGSFTCTCRQGFTGDGKRCDAKLGGPGYWNCASGTCEPVGPGYWSPDQDDNRYPCRAGYFCASGTNSTATGDGPCAAGYHCPEGSSTDTGAGICGPNTYSNAGAASCTNCPFNSQTSGPTDADHDSVEDCKGNGGWYECQKGSCSLAGAGYYSPAGDNHRYPCQAGSYCSTSSNSAPTGNGTCAAGHSCPAGSTSATGAGVCGPNTYAPAGSGSCTGCPANSSTSGSAAGDHDSVTDCRSDAGYYDCPSGTCKEAGAGYYSPAGDENRYPCGTGFYSSSNTAATCSACTNRPEHATTVIYATSSAVTSNDCPYETVVCGPPRAWTGTACQDSTPDAFSFTNRTGVEPASSVISNAITPSGFDGPLTLSCSGCVALARNGTWGGTSVTGVQLGDTIAVEATAPVSGQTINVTVRLGSTTTTWTITSRDLTQYLWKTAEYNSTINPSDASTWSFTMTDLHQGSWARTGAPLSGKVYAEFKSVSRPGDRLPIAFGIATRDSGGYFNAGRYAIVTGNGACGDASGTGYSANGGFTLNSLYAFGVNDVIGIAVDATAGKLWYSRNGVWISGDPAAGTSPTSTFPPGEYYFFTGVYGCWVRNGTAIHRISPKGGAYPTPAGFTTYDP